MNALAVSPAYTAPVAKILLLGNGASLRSEGTPGGLGDELL